MWELRIFFFFMKRCITLSVICVDFFLFPLLTLVFNRSKCNIIYGFPKKIAFIFFDISYVWIAYNEIFPILGLYYSFHILLFICYYFIVIFRLVFLNSVDFIYFSFLVPALHFSRHVMYWLAVIILSLKLLLFSFAETIRC